MANPQQGPASERQQEDAVFAREAGISRSFDPPREDGSVPAPVTAFAEGNIDQARIGRILMVCARDVEVADGSWEAFARWLVEEVRVVNGVRGFLILDLRRVRRLSARGLRALALAWQELAEDGAIAICGLNDRLTEIFGISHYDRLFEIHPNSTEAYRALSARARAPA